MQSISVHSYYADEGLGCEVFHYCQENQKHSWICPEGFSFHQVHLICMPPSGENICQQSSKYHVVNDYLYKPVNLAEHESKPNITLRYSERYYPENFYQDDRQDDYQQDRQRQSVSDFLKIIILMKILIQRLHRFKFVNLYQRQIRPIDHHINKLNKRMFIDHLTILIFLYNNADHK